MKFGTSSPHGIIWGCRGKTEV